MLRLLSKGIQSQFYFENNSHSGELGQSKTPLTQRVGRTRWGKEKRPTGLPLPGVAPAPLPHKRAGARLKSVHPCNFHPPSRCGRSSTKCVRSAAIGAASRAALCTIKSRGLGFLCRIRNAPSPSLAPRPARKSRSWRLPGARRGKIELVRFFATNPI